MRQRSRATELLDVYPAADAALAGNLHDLARINRWTGGIWLLQKALAHLFDGPPLQEFTLLDVGGGAGDTVEAVRRWARRRGGRCHGIVLDRSAPVLSLARQRPRRWLTLLRGDGRALPLRDRSVEVASCSLVLHHCADGEAIQLLAEMGRVARLGVIVDDLIRGHLGYAGACLLAYGATGNRLTRHDAPLSVRRAFRQTEAAALVEQAGLRLTWQTALPGYRMALVAQPQSQRRTRASGDQRPPSPDQTGSPWL